MRVRLWVLAPLAAGLLLATASGHAALINVEPDSFSAGTDIRFAFEGVTLSAPAQPTAAVVPLLGISAFLSGANIATTGQMVFARDPEGNCGVLPQDTAKTWQDSPCGMLKAVFAAKTDYVEIDVIFDDDDAGVLRAYAANGQLLQEESAGGDGRGPNKYAKLTISRASQDIAYVLAGGVSGEGIFLDNLRFQNYYEAPPVPAPEPATLALLGLGLAGLVVTRRRKQHSRDICGGLHIQQ